MSMVIQSFDNLHDNRVLRCCADFEAHTLHLDTRTEAGEVVSVHFTGLLAHWFEIWSRTTSFSAWMRSP